MLGCVWHLLPLSVIRLFIPVVFSVSEIDRYSVTTAHPVRSTNSYMFLQYSPMSAISTVETCSCAYALQDVLW